MPLLMINPIELITRRKRLNIRPPSKEHEFETSPQYVRGALGWLVDHAMNNGMTKLRIGVDHETKEPWMKFFGPHWYHQPKWWDLVPPPANSYPVMLQVCLSLAELEPRMPISGTIRAAKGRTRLPLQLEIFQINSIQISWGDMYSLDREEADYDYADEEPGSDATSDTPNGQDAENP